MRVVQSEFAIARFPAGMSSRTSPYSTLKFSDLTNWWPSPDDDGAIEVVPGASRYNSSPYASGVAGLMAAENGSQVRRRFVLSNGTLYIQINDSSNSNVKAGLSTSASLACASYGGVALFMNGVDTPFVHDFSDTTSNSIRNAGLSRPSTAGLSSAPVSPGAGQEEVVKGTVKYWFAEMNGTSEGPLSQAFGTINAGNGSVIRLSGFTPGTAKRIYRSTRESEIPRLLADLASASTQYDDATHDDLLGRGADLHGQAPLSTLTNPLLHFNRLWAFADNKLYWSDYKAPESWFTNNYLEIMVDDGDKLTAVARDRDGFFAFKNNHLYKVMVKDPVADIPELNEITLGDQSSKALGTPSNKSVVATELGYFFYFNRGVYLLAPSGLATYISNDIEDILRASINVAAQDKVRIGFHPTYRMVLVSAPTGQSTENDKTYCFFLDSAAWFVVNRGFKEFITVEDGTDGQPPQGYSFWGVDGADSTYIAIPFDTTTNTWSDGTAVSSTATFPPIYTSHPTRLTRFLWIDIPFKVQASGTFTVTTYLDGDPVGTSVAVPQTKTYYDDQLQANRSYDRWHGRVHIGRMARECVIEFSTNADQPRTKIFGFSLEKQGLTQATR